MTLESGKLEEALEFAGRALDVDPYNRAVRRILADIRKAAATAKGASGEEQ